MQKIINNEEEGFYLSLPVAPAPDVTDEYADLPKKIGGEPVRYVWKDIARPGTFDARNVNGGWSELSIDEAREDRFLRTFQEMKKDGVDVPIPEDHSGGARKNMGFLIDMRRTGNRLEGLMQLIGEDAHRTAARNRVSPKIVPTAYVGQKTYTDAIAHVALTPTPVITRQNDPVMVASREAAADATAPTPAAEKSTMAKTINCSDEQYAALLSLEPALKEADPVKAVDALIAKLKAPGAVELSRESFDKTKAELDAANAKIAELSRAHAAPIPEVLMSRHEASSAQIDLAVSRSELTPVMAKRAKDSLGAADKPNAFLLSRDETVGKTPIQWLMSLVEGEKLTPVGASQTGVQTLSRVVPDKDDKAHDPDLTKTMAAMASGKAK